MKAEFHIDEILSYGLSNGYKLPFAYQRINEWIPSHYFFDYLTVNQNNLFSYDSVIYNQIADVHPPLFYLLLHTISSLFPSVFSKWFGIGLNCIFYVFIYFIIIRITFLITKNNYLSYLAAVFWGLSIAALSSVVFIRMYVLLTLFSTLFFFYCIKYFEDNSHDMLNLLMIFITTVLGALTQYYFLIIAFFISATLMLLFLLKRRWKKIRDFTMIMLASLLTCLAVFPSILTHILSSSRGTEALSNAQSQTHYIHEYATIINTSIFGGIGLLIVPLLIAILIIGLYKNNYSRYTLLLLMLPIFCFLFVIQKIAPYQSDRYIFLIFPFIAITVVYVLSKTIPIKGLTILLLFISVIGLCAQEINYLTPQKREFVQPIDIFYENDVFILTEKSWKITNIMPELIYFEAIYPFIIAPKNLYFPEIEKINQSDSLVVYLDSDFEDNRTILQQLANNYAFSNYETIYTGRNFSAYIFTN